MWLENRSSNGTGIGMRQDRRLGLGEVVLGNPSGLRQFLGGELCGIARTAWARREKAENPSGARRLHSKGRLAKKD